MAKITVLHEISACSGILLGKDVGKPHFQISRACCYEWVKETGNRFPGRLRLCLCKPETAAQGTGRLFEILDADDDKVFIGFVAPRLQLLHVPACGKQRAGAVGWVVSGKRSHLDENAIFGLVVIFGYIAAEIARFFLVGIFKFPVFVFEDITNLVNIR